MSYWGWVQIGGTICAVFGDEDAGRSLELTHDGNIVAFGSPYRMGGGRVYAFYFDGAGWVQMGDSINGIQHAEEFGGAMSISGDGSTIAAGANQNRDNGENAGQTRIYRYSVAIDEVANTPGNWVQVGTINGEVAGDRCGIGDGIDLNFIGSIVAIGCTHADSGAGHVRVFHLTGDEWEQLGSNIPGTGGRFGYSVSLTDLGHTVAVVSICVHS